MTQPKPLDFNHLPPFLRARQVCAILSIGKSTLYALLAQDKFPPGKRIGGSRIWSTAEVLAFAQGEAR